MRYTKTAVNRLFKDTMAGAFEQGLNHEMLTFMSQDLVEALTSNEPDFRGA